MLSSGRRVASVSFVTLTEAYVLEALRTAGVKVRKIRPALTALQREFGTEYALTAPNLATDGIDVLWDFSKTPGGRGLIEARTGQTVMRAIVDYLTYITREDAGRPTRLRLQSCEPSKVIVDPHYGFGQPRFGTSGARMIDVAAMLKAGETAEVVADEFGISVHDVRSPHTRFLFLGLALNSSSTNRFDLKRPSPVLRRPRLCPFIRRRRCSDPATRPKAHPTRSGWRAAARTVGPRLQRTLRSFNGPTSLLHSCERRYISSTTRVTQRAKSCWSLLRLPCCRGMRNESACRWRCLADTAAELDRILNEINI